MPESLAEPVIFAAGTLIPISSPPLQDGALLVREGRIKAVGALADIGLLPVGPERDFLESVASEVVGRDV